MGRLFGRSRRGGGSSGRSGRSGRGGGSSGRSGGRGFGGVGTLELVIGGVAVLIVVIFLLQLLD